MAGESVWHKSECRWHRPARRNVELVRPERFELPTLWFVARCSIQLSYGRSTEQPAESFDYSGNSGDEGVGEPCNASGIQQNTLCAGLNIFFVTISISFGTTHASASMNVNLSHHWQFLPCTIPPPCRIFRWLELANRVLQLSADEVARNGAPLKINFGQRFSWTPLAFSLQLRVHLAEGSPPPAFATAL